MIAALLAACGLISAMASGAPLVAGWVEPVMIVETGSELPAKLDSGAEHSSLHAGELVLEERDGTTWARFTLQDHSGHVVRAERPVVRYAGIKRHGGEPQRRPVVRLTLCIGDRQREVDVNLVDRSRFDYPLLVGRSFLGGQYLIDPARQGLTRPACR